MTTPITRERVLESLAAAVERKGRDYVYPFGLQSSPSACVYFDDHDGAPSCIVGHVLADLGVTIEHLGPRNADSTIAHVMRAVERGQLSLDLEFTGDALHTLSEAQRMQDAGASWGSVLDSVGGAA